MLPLSQKYVFLLFALLTGSVGLYGFYQLALRILRGRPDTDPRTDRPFQRLWYALVTMLTQARTLRKRPWVSFFHSFIFYGFSFYVLVNLLDALEGYVKLPLSSDTPWGAIYNLLADVFSFLVMVGVIALVVRRFLLPSRRDFRFNAKTLLHPKVQRSYITRDSVIVSAFILFHVGSRSIGAGARLAAEGPDKFQPFATALSHLFTNQSAQTIYDWRVFGYWGALGSVLLFLSYFPYTKHVHLFMAPLKYFFARRPSSGVLPAVEIDLETEGQQIGASRLEDLAWPRLLDAYACIQCNRCQDVCPASATGKSLSPSALEINKRMELNQLASRSTGFVAGKASPRPLLAFALTPEALWACTTCGACMQVCPVEDEQMLDILDMRRDQVMMEGKFPQQLQAAFRGMERAKNPWGINHDRRMEWAEGLALKTIDENPTPEVLYWVGCAASYDPQAQKTARAFVQLLQYAGVEVAVLGKKECCTGDSARRAGNELLYRQLAEQNIATLNAVQPKLIVASCPHCMNALGKEYRQLGGNYTVMHHTEYLASLVSAGKLAADHLDASITYHDPCYLGRHNGVYDAPRNLLRVLGSEVLEMDRARENAFCCGAGGAQFWKEEEPGAERVSENRYREVQERLDGAPHAKTLAVGCPFCKSMFSSTPGNSAGDGIVVRDIAELLLEGVQHKRGIFAAPAQAEEAPAAPAIPAPSATLAPAAPPEEAPGAIPVAKAAPLPAASAPTPAPTSTPADAPAPAPAPERKKWSPKAAAPSSAGTANAPAPVPAPVEQKPVAQAVEAPPTPATPAPAPERKKWQPKAKS
ncbi:MAG: (Fe-S)-binding protein [Acidobacteriaceae bacterium]